MVVVVDTRVKATLEVEVEAIREEDNQVAIRDVVVEEEIEEAEVEAEDREVEETQMHQCLWVTFHIKQQTMKSSICSAVRV